MANSNWPTTRELGVLVWERKTLRIPAGFCWRGRNFFGLGIVALEVHR